MVFIGTLRTFYTDIKKMREESMKKMKAVVSDMIKTLVEKTKMGAMSSANNVFGKAMPKLPSVFSQLSNSKKDSFKKMNVIDIFKKLQTEEGLEEIVEEVIECAFTSMEKEMQGLSKELKKKIDVLKNLAICMTKQGPDQIKIFIEKVGYDMLSMVIPKKFRFTGYEALDESKDNYDETLNKYNKYKETFEAISKFLLSSGGIDTRHSLELIEQVLDNSDKFSIEKGNLLPLKNLIWTLKLLTKNKALYKTTIERIFNGASERLATLLNSIVKNDLHNGNKFEKLIQLVKEYGFLQHNEELFSVLISNVFKRKSVNGIINKIEKATQDELEKYYEDEMEKVKAEVKNLKLFLITKIVPFFEEFFMNNKIKEEAGLDSKNNPTIFVWLKKVNVFHDIFSKIEVFKDIYLESEDGTGDYLEILKELSKITPETPPRRMLKKISGLYIENLKKEFNKV
jgi:CRISPR/Cas system CSM-associated protein Csm5 (group 7 of RAMP superfamily)